MSSSPIEPRQTAASSASLPGAAETVEVVMPQMGVSVAEGTIIEWTKRPGDWVERDETVCMVTTDKVDVEIPSPAAGRLSSVLVEQGDTVDVGTPLAELDVGARPGEKLHEDLFNPHERPQPTPAQKILRAQRDPLDPAWVEQTFSDINLLVLEGDAAALAQRVSTLARERAAGDGFDARLAT